MTQMHYHRAAIYTPKRKLNWGLIAAVTFAIVVDTAIVVGLIFLTRRC